MRANTHAHTHLQYEHLDEFIDFRVCSSFNERNGINRGLETMVTLMPSIGGFIFSVVYEKLADDILRKLNIGQYILLLFFYLFYFIIF